MNKRLYCLTLIEYRRYFDAINPSDSFKYQINTCIERIMWGRNQYLAVEAETGVPWVFVALIHEMECDCDFSRQILNGQKIDEMTTIEPKGHGPWRFWNTSAIEGVQRYSLIKNWSVGEIGYYLEKHNGFGYRNAGLLSPYLFSGCQWGIDLGLYTKDGTYDPLKESLQAGAYVLLSELIKRELYMEPVAVEWPVQYMSRNDTVMSFQIFLNSSFGAGLHMDGVAGAKTSEAYKNQTGQYLIGDPRSL